MAFMLSFYFTIVMITNKHCAKYNTIRPQTTESLTDVDCRLQNPFEYRPA